MKSRLLALILSAAPHDASPHLLTRLLYLHYQNILFVRVYDRMIYKPHDERTKSIHTVIHFAEKTVFDLIQRGPKEKCN